MATTTEPAPPAPPAAPPDPTDRLEPRPPGISRHWLAAAIVIVLTLALLDIGLIPPAAVVLSLPFLYLLIRKPVLRRLALRNATRRPKETLLIVLGALLGTAIITSSYVVGDTLTASIHQSVYTQLGPVDEVVLANGPAGGAPVRAAVESARIADIDGTLPLLALQASVATTGPAPQAEPQAQILETDFAQARTFGGDPAATGMSGPTPTGDQAVIGADLARSLGVAPGRRVTVHAYGTARTFQVARVLPRLGVAGLYSFTSAFGGSSSPNLFVPPGTLNEMQSTGTSGQSAPPPLSILAVSNRGNVTTGVKFTAPVHSELVAALHGLPGLVEDAKKSLVDAANAAGKSFTQLFQTFGYFSVAVGVLLLINIFVMLAQERKQTLGMLRAVGLRRASLVGSFSLEGWVYAALSALAGTLIGVGIGRLVITATSRIFNQGGSRNNLSLHFSASVRSLQSGFLFGFVIALLTVVLTSLYVARLNVIRAIRDLPEPPSDGRRRSVLIFGTLLTLLGVGLTVAGVTGKGSAVPSLLGPALLGIGLAMLSLGRLPTRPAVSILSIAVVVWTIVASGVLQQAFDKAGLVVFFVQGLILNIYAVVLVTFNQQAIGAVIRTIGGGTRNMSLRLGLAYPLAKRFRTGLLLAMYAIVVFLLVLLTTISSFFGSQINDQIRKIGGGAAVIVDSNPAEPVPAAEVAKLPGVTAVAPTSSQTAQFRLGTGKFVDYTAVGYDVSLIGHGTPDLHSWDKQQYPTQADAYRAALADPTRILVGQNFGSRSFGPPGGNRPAAGDKATMRDTVTGQSVDATIVGILSDSFYDNADHVFIARTLSDRVFGPRSTSNLLFVSTAPGTGNDALAATINGRYIPNGANSHSFRKLVNDQFSVQNQFFTLIRGYVALGLLVGIAGLGVVMIRAVRERRREVGVLRALGFSGIAVRRAFLAESSFIALEGIAVGTALALITAWQLVDSGNFGTGTKFSVPILQLAVLIVVTFIASLIATAAPAIQASHIRPAVALRIAD